MKFKSCRRREGRIAEWSQNASGFIRILSCHLPTLSLAQASASFLSFCPFLGEKVFVPAVGREKFFFSFPYGQVQGKGEHTEALRGRAQRNKRAGLWSRTENTNNTALGQGSHQVTVAASLLACVFTRQGGVQAPMSRPWAVRFGIKPGHQQLHSLSVSTFVTRDKMGTRRGTICSVKCLFLALVLILLLLFHYLFLLVLFRPYAFPALSLSVSASQSQGPCFSQLCLPWDLVHSRCSMDPCIMEKERNPPLPFLCILESTIISVFLPMSTS